MAPLPQLFGFEIHPGSEETTPESALESCLQGQVPSMGTSAGVTGGWGSAEVWQQAHFPGCALGRRQPQPPEEPAAGEDGEAQPQLQSMEPFRGFAILNENESQSAPNELTEATEMPARQTLPGQSILPHAQR